MGLGVAAMAYMVTQTALTQVVWLVCTSHSHGDEHQVLFDCPAYSHTSQQYSHLLCQASSSIAAFLATDQPNIDVHMNVSGSFLNTCFLPRQFVLISPLVAWLQNFAEQG